MTGKELSMKKTLTIIFTSLSLLLILDSMNVGQAITMFLLAGVIPGTNIAISAATMLEFFALLIGFTLARISNRLMFLALTKRNPSVKPSISRA